MYILMKCHVTNDHLTTTEGKKENISGILDAPPCPFPVICLPPTHNHYPDL